jgi:hypothetical protein
VLIAVNGEPVGTTEQAAKIIRASANKPLQLTLKREDQTFTVQVTPRLERGGDGEGGESKKSGASASCGTPSDGVSRLALC